MDIERLSIDEIMTRAWDDGYELTEQQAAAVRRAAAEGRLLWTSKRLTVVGRDALDLRPDPASGEDR